MIEDVPSVVFARHDFRRRRDRGRTSDGLTSVDNVDRRSCTLSSLSLVTLTAATEYARRISGADDMMTVFQKRLHNPHNRNRIGVLGGGGKKRRVEP